MAEQESLNKGLRAAAGVPNPVRKEWENMLENEHFLNETQSTFSDTLLNCYSRLGGCHFLFYCV